MRLQPITVLREWLTPHMCYALIQSDSNVKGSHQKSRLKSFSSRSSSHADTFDSAVDHFDVEDDELSSSEVAAALPDSGDDADRFNIVNNCASE